MEYYIEISRLVDKALSGNRIEVVNQVTKLVDLLEKNGDMLAAQGLAKKLSSSGRNAINAQSVFQKPIPVEKDNRFALADKSMPSESSSKVFLSDGKTQDVKAFLDYIRKQDKLYELGIPSNPSLLLHGVPGTGKSQLASHIACELSLPLITARSDALISSYLGSTSKNIRSLLEYANSEPCVLFLDEFDSIAKARDDKNEIGELKRVVVSLLQNIDSLDNTVVIAATNHPHLLDPAVWRRFHYKMELGLPEHDVRHRIIDHLLNTFRVNESDISVLAKITDQMTGAEIEMVIHEYLRFIIVNDFSFELGALCRKILADKHSNLTFDVTNRKEELAWLHECDTNLYTYRLLALVFDISSSYVGKLLKGNK
ncbi:DNA-binding protein [Vibrio vulnificus]|uniref:ATP-binding protein n=2 Tax=Vibrio TaxID=662 RepID=A0AA47JML4_VIBPH|nr:MULTISPECIES: ATP-binding protein [Vibrio]MBE3699164.1 ATP-binding protein [Vibrio parahaemolyticus]MBE3779047.1 ATP-binding protein [Vibrio parahaemolyticus]MBN8083268.1 ATP-binding protein [Vibrio vulnificus]MBN8087199.1 ATP-binding protein [Vibrio vulnificus]MBN8093094.1 ATP-binding protein [Vibrio vulnificus]